MAAGPERQLHPVRMRWIASIISALMLAMGLVATSSTPAYAATGDFVSTWTTGNTSTGSSTDTQVRLPLTADGTYNFTVNWGDASLNDTITAYDAPAATHTYTSADTYTITISGTIEGWRFNGGGDRLKIVGISQWGDLKLGNLGAYFSRASNLTSTATDSPDLTGTTNLSQMFFQASAFNQPIGAWNVSNVTNMVGMFLEASAFNQPIGAWNVSNVTDMAEMFLEASAFNQPIGAWNVSNVTDMAEMFDGASAFNQPIGAWNVSNVTNMVWMFSGVTLSPVIYGALLTGWSSLSGLKTGVAFSAGNSMYPGSAVAARLILTSGPLNWVITDAGLAPTSVPGAPSITSVVAGNGQVSVHFTAGGDGGSPITNYEYSTNNGTSWTARDPASVNSPLTITGLTNGTTYNIKLRAVNTNGPGAASNSMSGTPTAPVVPGVPCEQLLNELRFNVPGYVSLDSVHPAEGGVGCTVEGTLTIPGYLNTLMANQLEPTAHITATASNQGVALVLSGSADLVLKSKPVLSLGAATLTVGKTLSAGIEFAKRPDGQELTLSIGADAKFNMATGIQIGNNPMPALKLDLHAEYSVNLLTQDFGVTVNQIGKKENAFGLTGLTVKKVAGSISKEVETGALSAAFAGKATLADKWIGPTLGINKDATVTFAYNNGGLGSCAQFGISKPKGPGDGPALNLFKADLVKANYLNIAIAPSGCSIGDIEVGPGFNLAFDGKVGGAKAKIVAKLKPKPDGSYEIAALVDIDHFNINGLADFEDVKMNLSKGSLTDLTIDFVGTGKFLGGAMSVAGNITNKQGKIRFGLVADLAPKIAGLRLAGVHAEFTAKAEWGKPVTFVLDAEVKLPLFGTGTKTSNKKITSPVTCGGNRGTGPCISPLQPLTYKPVTTKVSSKKNSAAGNFQLKYANGVMTKFSGSAELKLDILETELSGDVSWKWNSETKKPVTLKFVGYVNLFGTAKIDVSGKIASVGFSFTAKVTKHPGVDLTVFNVGFSGKIHIHLDVHVGYEDLKPSFGFDGTLKAEGCIHYLVGKECKTVGGSLSSNGKFTAKMFGKKISVNIKKFL